MKIRNLGLSLLSMLALAAFTPAQGAIGLPDSLTTGDIATITFTDSGRAGEIIIVKVSGDGGGEEDEFDVEIHLDENGEGSEDFEVPGGEVVTFITDQVTEVRFTEAPPAVDVY